MKLSRFSSVVLAAALMLPAAAQAQIQTLQFDGVKTAGGDQVGGAATGAYRAHATAPIAGSPFDIYCLDYDHNAQSVWTAHSVTFAQATGIYLTQAQRQLGTEKVWGIAELRAAAYLTTQFGPVGPGASDDNWDTIHGAIWSMFSTNASVNLSAYTTVAANAVAFAGGQTSWDSDYVLILDDKVFAANYNPQTANLTQGFITEDQNTNIQVVTPEPSTYLLMGAGLFAVGLVRRRRRNV